MWCFVWWGWRDCVGATAAGYDYYACDVYYYQGTTGCDDGAGAGRMHGVAVGAVWRGGILGVHGLCFALYL